jgi:hypothetical protein
MAGFGSKGGSDDKEKDAANTDKTGNDLPLVSGGALRLQLAFGLGESGRLVAPAEPACLHRRASSQHEGGENEDEMMMDVHRFSFRSMKGPGSVVMTEPGPG